MKTRISLCIAAIAAVALSGCASLTPPARTHELTPGKPYVIDYDASRRGAYVLPADGSLKVCAEPAPDVALESITKIIAELKLADPNVDASTQIELQTKVVELAGRTQLVLVLRESLYRLCEQGINGSLSQEQVSTLYTKVLDTIVMLAQSDLAKEQKEIIQNLRDPELRRIFQGILDQGVLESK
ncbi:MAG: hypothetical protein KC777_15055 [Cyanobacteria bacterium HKST-UBA02]|nr:hypothetical protein [Cyanobacteria bacterium HKST-UBA02]